MQHTGMVPVFFHPELAVSIQVLEACYRGGVRAFEFTNRGDFAHEIFAGLVKHARKNLPGMAIGAGTIIDAATATLFMQNGADFIVSPYFREEIAIACNRRKVLWASGCASLTEISKAEEFGAEIVKLFPGSQLGPSFVKAAKGPMPWTSLMPTGGVEPTVDSLKAWFEAGVVCVGIGSQLFPKHVLDAQDWAYVEEKCSICTRFVFSFRSK
jgi:2-dehydro-3-deoxyphosphogluconate aldolase/(4S)-4-hydroxy-2-oxoglutarate aldolase